MFVGRNLFFFLLHPFTGEIECTIICMKDQAKMQLTQLRKISVFNLHGNVQFAGLFMYFNIIMLLI